MKTAYHEVWESWHGNCEEGKAKIIKSRELIEKNLDEGRPMYGVNTGIGKFSDISISSDKIEDLQKYLIVADPDARVGCSAE